MDELQKLLENAGVKVEVTEDSYERDSVVGLANASRSLKMLREDIQKVGFHFQKEGEERYAQGIQEALESVDEGYKILQHIMADIAMGQFKRNT